VRSDPKLGNPRIMCCLNRHLESLKTATDKFYFAYWLSQVRTSSAKEDFSAIPINTWTNYDKCSWKLKKRKDCPPVAKQDKHATILFTICLLEQWHFATDNSLPSYNRHNYCIFLSFSKTARSFYQMARVNNYTNYRGFFFIVLDVLFSSV
jgi:hypothetical protein